MPTTAQRLDAACRRWALKVGESLPGGSRSTVYAVTDADDRDLVLKFPAPRPDDRSAAALEATALMSWSTTNAAVTVLDHTVDALLLERARPGLSWPWQSGPSATADLVAVASDLLLRIWAAPVPCHDWPTLTGTYAEAERVAHEDAACEQRQRGEPGRGLPGLRHLPAARTTAQALSASTVETRLLHGDFITKNLISHAGSDLGWVALDPQPVLGDPCSEVGGFAAYQPADLILPVAEAMSRQVRLDADRCLRWTAVWAVHQAAQAWRDDQSALDALVGSRVVTNLLSVRRPRG